LPPPVPETQPSTAAQKGPEPWWEHTDPDLVAEQGPPPVPPVKARARTRFTCPACGTTGSVKGSQARQLSACPRCGATLVPVKPPKNEQNRARAPVLSIGFSLLLVISCLPVALAVRSPLLGTALALPALVLGLYALGVCLFGRAWGLTLAALTVGLSGP